MATLAQRISETPIAPYLQLLNEMTVEQKQIVVMYITEQIERSARQMSAEEEIREKYKGLRVSPEIHRLRGCIKLNEEDLADERTQYILRK
ncbi:MAG: hypothetical protein IJU62_07760 [Muribaculaceae bacterium]|nr:hypothetical protein [Muribaculaceae bacterium]